MSLVELERRWQDERDEESIHVQRDEQLVQALSDLLDETQKRSGKIETIAQHLEKELLVLTAFMDKVQRRRPPGQ